MCPGAPCGDAHADRPRWDRFCCRTVGLSPRRPGCSSGLCAPWDGRPGSPLAWRHPPGAVGCVGASRRCRPPGCLCGRGLPWPAGLRRSKARRFLCRAGRRAGICTEPHHSPSVLSAQTPSPATFLNIYSTQRIMHLFKCIINAFKCVRLYQNAWRSLPVRPRVTSLAKKLLLAHYLALLLSEGAIAGFVVAAQSGEANPGRFRHLVRVQS